MTIPASPDATPADLQIIGAAYGQKRVTSQVIGLVNRQSVPQSLAVAASDQIFGDQWPGHQQSLTVVYRTGSAGTARVAAVTEGNMLSIQAQAPSACGRSETADSPPGPAADPGAGPPQLTIFGATYGQADVTALVRSLVNAGTQSLSLTPGDQILGGDPWPNNVKTFVIVAAYTGQVPFLDIVTQGTAYSLKYRPPLQILLATWGMNVVTDQVQAATFRRTLTIAASSELLGDGFWPDVTKSLDVIYQYGDEKPQLAIVTDGQTLSIDYQPQGPFEPSPDPRALNVIKAAYGRRDVTATVAGLVTPNGLQFEVSASLFGDNWPGTRKSFAMAYSWGPVFTRAPATGAQGGYVVAQDGMQWDLSLPAPEWSIGQLVSLAGLLADGDITAIEASNGQYWGIDTASGRIIANAGSVNAAAKFTVHVADPDSGEITLSAAGGASVVVGPDGLLHTQTGGTAAVLMPSLTLTGSILLSVAGQDMNFAALTADGSISAAGSDLPTFDACFSPRINATRAGTGLICAPTASPWRPKSTRPGRC